MANRWPTGYAPTPVWRSSAGAEGMLDVCGRERQLVVRTRERYAAVQQMIADGASLGAISRGLQLDRSTVRRYARAASIEELLTKASTAQGCSTGSPSS